MLFCTRVAPTPLFAPRLPPASYPQFSSGAGQSAGHQGSAKVTGVCYLFVIIAKILFNEGLPQRVSVAMMVNNGVKWASSCAPLHAFIHPLSLSVYYLSSIIYYPSLPVIHYLSPSILIIRFISLLFIISFSLSCMYVCMYHQYALSTLHYQSLLFIICLYYALSPLPYTRLPSQCLYVPPGLERRNTPKIYYRSTPSLRHLSQQYLSLLYS